MSGRTIFLTGSSLICLPKGLLAIYALLSDLPWFFPAVGAAIFSNLAYCAWRGERWAYYLLLFLCAIGILSSMVLFVAAKDSAPLFPVIVEAIGMMIGGCLLVLHPSSKEFLEQQRGRFKSAA